MYIRSKLQPRAIDNIARLKEKFYPNSRVTKGFVISNFLEKHDLYTENEVILNEALIESENKIEGPGISINLNITSEANEALNNLKIKLDKMTGRSLFPAQVIDILLISVLNQTEKKLEITDKQLAKILLDFSYRLLCGEITVQEEKLKEEIYNILKG